MSRATVVLATMSVLAVDLSCARRARARHAACSTGVAYRDALHALQIKRTELLARRAAIDAELAENARERRAMAHPNGVCRPPMSWIALAAVSGVFVLVLAGIYMNCLCDVGPETVARTELRTIATTAEQYMIEHPDAPCPTPLQLARDGFLPRRRFGKMSERLPDGFSITCVDDTATTTAPGDDRRYGTSDDISSNEE
jgi:hypothetical protein